MSAAECEAADARGGNDSSGNGQSKDVAGVVDLAPGATGRDTGRPGCRVDPNPFHH